MMMCVFVMRCNSEKRVNDVENGGERSKKSPGKKVSLCNEFWADLFEPGVDRERMTHSQ